MTTRVRNSTVDSVANTKITGLITSGQIATVANTQITGLIRADQIASIPTSAITGLTGELKMWPVATPPTGYFLCDGSPKDRTVYSDLFAIIGTTYGAGDGSSTFNLPNFTNRMAIGAGGLYSANSMGGSKDAIVVSHTHSVTDPGHSHPIDKYYNGTGGNYPELNGFTLSSPVPNPTPTGLANTGISIASAGSSGTNANLPPYLGVYFIIRYL